MKRLFYLIVTFSFVFAAAALAARAQNETSGVKETVEKKANEFRFKVKHKHLRKSCQGELIINEDGAEYLTEYNEHRRNWLFTDIKLFKLISETKIEIITYQQRQLRPSLDETFKFGSDESFKFELLDGEITRDLSEFLLARIKRPVVTTFIHQPVEAKPPLYVLPARHRHRWGGCNGELRIYEDKVIYESFEDAENSRLWRWSDLQSFGRSNRYKFEITTFEPQTGGEKTFNFDLKEEMTDEIYDYLWKKFYKVTYYTPVPRKL